MKFLKRLRRTKPKSLRETKTWILVLIVVVLFPPILWFSQVIPMGLDFMKVINGKELVWNLPNFSFAIVLTAIYLCVGLIVFPMVVIRGACLNILIDRVADYKKP